ncbi:GAF domain-containing protein [Anaerolineales bacterium HSG24]|nr:GAF domain-containing protein [Anaerolineales bacterium HSG24]
MKLFNNLRVRTKIFIGYLIILVMLVIVGAVAITRFNQINATVANLAEQLAVEQKLSDSIVAQTWATQFFANEYISSQAPADLAQYSQALTGLNEILAEAETVISHDGRAKQLADIKTMQADYSASFVALAPLLTNRNNINSRVLNVQQTLAAGRLAELGGNAVNAGDTEIATLASDAQRHLSLMQSYVSRYLASGTTNWAKSALSEYDQLLSDIDQIIDTGQDPDLQATAQETKMALETYNEGFTELQADYDQLLEIIGTRLNQLGPAMRETAQAMSDSASADFQEAEATTQDLVQQTQAVLLITIGLATMLSLGLGLGLSQNITQPLQTLTEAAEQIQAGDLTVHAQVTSGDEIGQLADTFNSMTANLRQTRDDLEDRQQALRQQNKYLNSTAELSERLSAILNIDELLMELVNQLKAKFNYYHVHVYLLDESNNMLVMTAGTGTAGATMKEQGHAIALDTTSIVVQAALSGEVVRIVNVHEIENWLPNPLLPDTHAELAVPIIREGQVVGVLDVQNEAVGGLDEGDATLLRSLVGHVAVALSNARLFSSEQQQRCMSDSLRQVATILNRSLDRDTVLDELMAQLGQVIEYDGASVFLVDGDDIFLDRGAGFANSYTGYRVSITNNDPAAEVFRDKRPCIIADVHQDSRWQTWDDDGTSIRSWMGAPLLLGQAVIGVLTLDNFKVSAYQESDAYIVQSFADQAATAINNVRLYEEAQQAKEKADSANKAKSDFLSSMSHELRTPLNGILGYAQILKRDKNLTTFQSESIQVIQNSGEHLLTLINDILDLSKIEAGKLELNPASTYLPTFLDGVAGMIRMRAEQKSLLFGYEPAINLPTGVEVDEKRLRQILLNLLGNAIKFTDDGQVIFRVSLTNSVAKPPNETTVFANWQTLQFEVVDTGAGISSDKLASVFNPFEQVGDQMKQAEGTGLGLAISQQLVQAMGSDLQLKSELGQGTQFSFEVTLPVVEINEDLIKLEPQRPVVGYSGPRRKALVVDDKDYNRSVLVSMIEPLGFEIAVAKNGQEAVEQTKALQPDVILMDMIMPIMTGFEATQIIRKTPSLQETVIIGASASAFEKDKERVRLAGCDAFLAKPLRTSELLDTLEELLQLEWLYEETEVTPSTDVKDIEVVASAPISNMALPTSDGLETLHTLAKRRRLRKIRKWAVEFEGQYPVFTAKLQILAKNFDNKGMLTLIEQSLATNLTCDR